MEDWLKEGRMGRRETSREMMSRSERVRTLTGDMMGRRRGGHEFED